MKAFDHAIFGLLVVAERLLPATASQIVVEPRGLGFRVGRVDNRTSDYSYTEAVEIFMSSITETVRIAPKLNNVVAGLLLLRGLHAIIRVLAQQHTAAAWQE